MSSELRIPEGIVVRTARGGSNVLNSILSDLKQYAFNGYVKVILRKNTISSIGYLVIDQGVPTMSIYQFEKTQPRDMRRIYAGDKSMRFIWEDSQDKQSLIELHSRVPREEFDRRFPDAKLKETDLFEVRKSEEAPRAAPRKTAPEKRPAIIEKQLAPEEKDPIFREIQKLRQQGYIVDNLEKMFRTNRTAAKKELVRYQENISQLESLEERLESFPNVGLDADIADLKKRLVDPEKLDELKAEIEALEKRIGERIEQTKLAEKKIEEDLKRKKMDEKAGDLYDIILEYQRGQAAEQEPVSAEEVPVEAVQEKLSEKETVCDRCGGALGDNGLCRKCGETGIAIQQLALSEGMCFESFVVGRNNKFAHAAAVAVAETSDRTYNPLFLYGKSGLGKTHLLNAIVRRMSQDESSDGIIYLSAEQFSEQLERALESGSVPRFRDAFRGNRALLIDDFQFLAGREAAQGELMSILDETMRKEGQVVIASDRLPKEIPRLSEQLVAKIQGGMIADLQQPDKQTRIDILRKKAGEKDKTLLPDPVIVFIAEGFQENVRELEAALNRLIAFAAVMKLEIDLQLAKEVLMPTMSSREAVSEGKPEINIRPGHSYLIEEDRPRFSNELFTKKISEGYRGLEITRMNPSQVRQEFGVEAEILWLTDKESKMEKTISPSLEMMVHKIEEFAGQTEKSVLLIDGLQYLISNTSFEGVLRFIRRLIDEFSESNSIMMISISPGTLDSRELSILERELETVKLSSG